MDDILNELISNPSKKLPKKVLVALPPGLLAQVDYVSKVEHRTRSDLIRESLRRYLENFKRTRGEVITFAKKEST